jgi:hypothetical chaperone protein
LSRLEVMLMSSFEPEVYAIDFGTSNSLLAAASRSGHHPPIPLDPVAEDPSLLRSVLFFPEARGPAGAAPALGKAALEEYVAQGSRGRLVRSLKRFLPMRGFVRTQINARTYTLEELIAIVLRAMRERADRHFGVRVTRAVLGRPARFAEDLEDDAFAEERLRQAARLAGFTEVAFCPEPVAAARDFRAELSRDTLLLVGDFGGGTSDYSLVMMGQGGFSLSDVLAIGGVSVAGDALDGSIMRAEVARHFGAEVRYRVPFGDNLLTMPKPLMEKLCSPAEMSLLAQRDVQSFLNDVRSWSRGADDRRHIDQLFALVEDGLGFMLFEAIEHAKKALSRADEAAISFHVPGIELDQPICRDGFERGARRQLSAIIAALDATLERAGARASDVEQVCLTGGTARVPFLRAALGERFGEHRLHSLRGLHAVAEGLARHAHRLLAERAL